MKNTLLLGTRKGLIVYRRSGGNWSFSSEHFEGVPVSYAMEDARSGRWWACLDHGHWGVKLHFTDDGGKNWTEVAAPAFGENDFHKEGEKAVVKYLWGMAAGGLQQSGKLFIGTDPGGLFESTDDGATWSLNRPLWELPSRLNWFGGGRDNAGIHSIVVDPRDADHFYIAVSCAGVFETLDGGKTWRAANKGLRADYLPDPDAEVGQDPHILVQCPAQPDILWQQHHCGIFVTRDGGRNWNEVSQPDGPAKFGFAIAVDEKDGNTAWVVPAVADAKRVAIERRLMVCRTQDGGKTWEPLTAGLPQQHCYDIVYRHSLDISEDTLAFGSTTGNVFVSEDRGNTWAALSYTLPMIYSARFAK